MVAARAFCPSCGSHPRGNEDTCESDGTPLISTQPGSMLGMEVGNYVLVRALGEGGMGAVYRAIHPRIGAEVGIKILHASSESQAQRFLLEAQTVNRVRHPNLIKILDTGYLSDRRPYLVMELLDGVPLSDVVGKLGSKLAVHVAAEALDALDAVHDVAVVHRDIKPANLFLTREGRVVVLDFGIAKVIDGSPAITRSAALIGTPEYMPPEQIRSQPIDRRADIYAMGVVLYESLTGRRPFAAAATFEMLLQHIERAPTSPRDYVPELPQGLTLATLRALEKDPANRFQRASEMAEALRAAVDTTGATDELAALVEARAPARVTPPRTPQRHDIATRDEGPRSSSRDAVTRQDSPRSAPPRSAPPVAVDDPDPGATTPGRPAGQGTREAATPSRRRLIAIIAAAGLAAIGIYGVTRGSSNDATTDVAPRPEPATGKLEATKEPLDVAPTAKPANPTPTNPKPPPGGSGSSSTGTAKAATKVPSKPTQPPVTQPPVTQPPVTQPVSGSGDLDGSSRDAGTAPPPANDHRGNGKGSGSRPGRKPNPWD